MSTLDDINSLDEAAAYLKIEKPKLVRLARTGKIGSLKEGRAWLFPRSVIEAYVAANTVEAAPPNPFGLTDRGLARVRGRA